MIIDTKNDIGPWQSCRVFLNEQRVLSACIYADDEQGIVIREWVEDITPVVPPDPVKRRRYITEHSYGPVRIELL